MVYFLDNILIHSPKVAEHFKIIAANISRINIQIR